MTKRLVIDLEKCTRCQQCAARCSYFYRAKSSDRGVETLRERASFALLCRRCPDPSCITACAFGALERRPDGLLQRHNLRCVACKLCAHACPFGIIDPDVLNFHETPCDFCAGSAGDTPPLCVTTCTGGALDHREVEPSEERVHLIGEHLAAVADAWPEGS